jgi:hypothetical protein
MQNHMGLMTNDLMTIIKEGTAVPGKATAHFFPTFLVRTIKKHKGFRAEYLEQAVGISLLPFLFSPANLAT